MCSCQLSIYSLSFFIIYSFVLVFIVCRSFISFIIQQFVLLLFAFISHRFFVLFVVRKKKNNSDPELVFRYFDPANHHQYDSINIIQQTPPTFS